MKSLHNSFSSQHGHHRGCYAAGAPLRNVDWRPKGRATHFVEAALLQRFMGVRYVVFLALTGRRAQA